MKTSFEQKLIQRGWTPDPHNCIELSTMGRMVNYYTKNGGTISYGLLVKDYGPLPSFTTILETQENGKTKFQYFIKAPLICNRMMTIYTEDEVIDFIETKKAVPIKGMTIEDIIKLHKQ